LSVKMLALNKTVL